MIDIFSFSSFNCISSTCIGDRFSSGNVSCITCNTCNTCITLPLVTCNGQTCPVCRVFVCLLGMPGECALSMFDCVWMCDVVRALCIMWAYNIISVACTHIGWLVTHFYWLLNLRISQFLYRILSLVKEHYKNWVWLKAVFVSVEE